MNTTASGHISTGGRPRNGEHVNQVNTIGSIPMRSIAINITKDVQDHRDGSITDKNHSFLDSDSDKRV